MKVGCRPVTGEPPKRLVGFEKVWLKPGERRNIAMTIDPAASDHPFGIFDADRQAWRIPAGAFKVMLGTSSAENVGSAEIVVTPPEPGAGR